MNAGQGAYGVPSRATTTDPHPFRWVALGFAIMLVLIGAAVVLAVLSPGPGGRFGGAGFSIWPFNAFWGLFWLVLIVWMCSWFFRRSWWYGPWSGRYRGYRSWGSDDTAATLARERYAKGEISRDQFAQIMQDLEQHQGRT